MSQISRLRDSEITNGNLINADDIDAELNQLVAESNSQDGRLTGLETGNVTLTGTKSFSSPIKTDDLQELSPDAGVTVDTVKLKDGSIRLAQKPGFACSENGEIGYDSTAHVYRLLVNNTAKYLVHEGNPVLHKGGITGPAPLYSSGSVVLLKAGLSARDATNTTDITLIADINLSLDTAGLNGLDTGTKAASTWYYVYLVKRSVNGATGAIFSTANVAGSGSITLPTGYDLYRQLPLAVKTEASSNIMPFYISMGWPYRTTVRYRFVIEALNYPPRTNQPNVLDGGTATTYTDVSLASYVPPISTQAILRGGIYLISGTSNLGFIRKKGSTADEFVVSNLSGRTYTEYESAIVETSADQKIQYLMYGTGSSAMDLNVQGYIVTEVN